MDDTSTTDNSHEDDDKFSVIKDVFYMNETYKIKLGQIEQKIRIIIDQEDNCSIDYFISVLTLEDIKKLGKSFRQFDSIEEAMKGLNNIFNKKNSGTIFSLCSFFLSDKTKEKFWLNIKNPLLNGEDEIIKIELKRKDKDKDLIIKNLTNYVLKLKGMNSIIKNNSPILENMEQLKFIEDNILKKLNLKDNKKIVYKLLYKATKDGDNGDEFHKRCDNYSPTLSIYKTKKDLIFGGFTEEKWNCDQENKKDNNSFCFQLNQKKIYNIINDKFAICCRKNIGPSFYNGCSGYAFIWSDYNFFSSSNNHTCKVNECAYDNISKDYEINDGEKNYQIIEIEVFQIIVMD